MINLALRRCASATVVLVVLATCHAGLKADTFGLPMTYILIDGFFFAVNGEKSGYIEAELTTTAPVTVMNVDPQFPASGTLSPGSPELASFKTNVTTEDGDGKRHRSKVVKVARAGPGEQIALAFSHLSRPAVISIVLVYHDESGAVLGRTFAHTVSVSDYSSPNRTSLGATFMRQDLRR